MDKTHPTMSNESMKWLFGKKVKPTEKIQLPFSMKVTRTIRRSYEFVPKLANSWHYKYPLTKVEA